MALGKTRTRIFVRGLGTCKIRQVDPSPAASFSDIGYLKSATLNDSSEMVDIVADNGHMAEFLRSVQKAMFDVNLFQVSYDEIDLIKSADGKLFALRYHGLEHNEHFQYFCAEQVKLDPSVAINFTPGERLLPLRSVAIDKDLAYNVPLYYHVDAYKEMFLDGLKFWVDPILGHNAGTAKLLDISGFALHGDINSDFASIWQTGTPARFLRFDGTNDEVNFGNNLTVNATEDFIFELWFRVQGADGSQQEVMSKKADVVNTDGWEIRRDTSNKALFKISDGATSATIVTTSTVLQNVWKHFLVAVDRNGNVSTYLNGVADGTPVSVAGVGDSSSSDNLYLGRTGSGFGQVDIGAVRIYQFAAGALPTNIATMASNHYNGEKVKYGL